MFRLADRGIGRPVKVGGGGMSRGWKLFPAHPVTAEEGQEETGGEGKKNMVRCKYSNLSREEER